MPRNTSGLKRTAGPGRPKGAVNASTRAVREFALELVESPEWQASARARILAGKAPHLEAYLLRVLLPVPRIEADFDRITIHIGMPGAPIALPEVLPTLDVLQLPEPTTFD